MSLFIIKAYFCAAYSFSFRDTIYRLEMRDDGMVVGLTYNLSDSFIYFPYDYCDYYEYISFDRLYIESLFTTQVNKFILCYTIF